MGFFKRKLKNRSLASIDAKKKKIKKRKNYVVRDFIKEMKRVKWSNQRDYVKLFLIIIVFTIVVVAIIYGITIGFTTLFNRIGVGI